MPRQSVITRMGFAVRIRRNDPRQISPDANGFVIEVNGEEKGYIKVDEAKKELTFLWVSASEAWPSKFALVSTGSPPNVDEIEVYEHGRFPTETTSLDVATCDYKIIQDGKTVGYLRRRSDGLDWYAVPGSLKDGYFPAEPMTFVANSDTGTITAAELKDDQL